MVYCGRPSASCALCRVKKRRCDKATPSCGHCRRTGQKCPGYLDASSLRIRDETTRVIDRARILRDHHQTLGSGSLPSSPHSTPPSVLPSSVGSRALAALSDHTASSSTLGDNENKDYEDNEENLGRDSVRKCERERQKDRYEENIIDNAVGNEHFLVSNEMELLSNDASVRWEPELEVVTTTSSPNQSQSLDYDLNDYVIPMPTSLAAAPSESLQELGISYFLTNYVVQDSGPCPGFLNCTSDILADPLSDTELVQVAIRAAGLAGLASTMGAYDIMCRARSSYAEAIKRVNAALMDSSMSSKDSTIFAVIILGLFETITCTGNESLEAWKHHVNGAANLLMHRGTSQLGTKQGSRIFGEAVSHVLTLCSRYNLPVPPHLRYLRIESERSFSCKTPSWLLSSAHIEVMDLYLRVDPDQEAPFLPNEWEQLLSQALELDQRLENLVAELPLDWRFKTVNDPGADSRIVYHNTYHIYYNTWVAKVWNGIRACRIILNQAIYCLLIRERLEYELSLDGGTYTTLLRKVSDITTEMSGDILASVPQMLGFVHHDPATGISYLECSTAGSSRLKPASGAYFLLWFLFLAGSLPITQIETRAWIVNRLYAIRSATGIQKASYLAGILEINSVSLHTKFLMNEFLFPNC